MSETCNHNQSQTQPWGSAWMHCDLCGAMLTRVGDWEGSAANFRNLHEWNVWWHSTLDRMTNHWEGSSTRERTEISSA